MRADVFVEILTGLEAIEADATVKRQFVDLVRLVAIGHGSGAMAKLDQVAFARRLIGNRVSRPTIRDRLVATFGLSRTQAYRVIDEALQLSQKEPVSGTTFLSNQSIDIEG